MTNYLNSLFKNHQRRSTLRHLRDMDDRLLLDIGLTRSDIDLMAQGSGKFGN